MSPSYEPKYTANVPIEKKLEYKTMNTTPATQDEASSPEPLASAKKQEQMRVTKCKHTDRKHYAKNLCANCYRRFGRDIKATKCKHKDRLAYSLGMCQACYLSDYHKRRANGQLLRTIAKK